MKKSGSPLRSPPLKGPYSMTEANLMMIGADLKSLAPELPELVVILPGEPVPWAPKQTNQRTGNRFFPKRQREAYARLKPELEKIPRGLVQAPLPFFEGEPLLLSALFYVSRPAYHYGTGRNRLIIKDRYRHLKRPTGTPDLSNCVKFAEDVLVLAGVFPDDKQIVGYYPPFDKTYKDHRDDGSRSVLRLKRLVGR